MFYYIRVLHCVHVNVVFNKVLLKGVIQEYFFPLSSTEMVVLI